MTNKPTTTCWDRRNRTDILYKSKQGNKNFQKSSPKIFVTKPSNMSTVGFLGTPGNKIGHFELTQDHLDTEDTKGMRRSLCLFVPNPYNMGVYGLAWTPAFKFWHFELTQDHLGTEDTEGDRRALCPFCSKPLQYGCLWTPLDPSNQDLTF